MPGAFFRHRGLIAFSAGGAMAEAAVLSFLAPSARPLAPQVTALPPLSAYHDLRWLFAFNQTWLGFTAVLMMLVLARAAVDAVLLQLAWPSQADPGAPGLPRPRFGSSVVSCAVLTILVGLVMSPVVTLMFGVALLPFSWPYLAAVPILLGTAVALSQGGVGPAWWRRLPPVRTAAWLIATFLVLSLASALMAHLDTAGIVAVAGLAGVVDARAWYALTTAAVRRSVERPLHPWAWRATLQRFRRSLLDRTAWVPMAPLAAVMVIALVAGLTRLAFTGAVRFDPGPVVASAAEGAGLSAVGHTVSTGAVGPASSPAQSSPGQSGGRHLGGRQTPGRGARGRGLRVELLQRRRHAARGRAGHARAPVLLSGPDRRRRSRSRTARRPGTCPSRCSATGWPPRWKTCTARPARQWTWWRRARAPSACTRCWPATRTSRCGR